jgi:hypothetical protein
MPRGHGHLGAIVITDPVRNVSHPHKDVKHKTDSHGVSPGNTLTTNCSYRDSRGPHMLAPLLILCVFLASQDVRFL